MLLLAGRAWRVTHLDWRRRRAYVGPAEDAGRSRWRGEGQFLGRELCGAIRGVLADGAISSAWSRRAVGQIEALRAEAPWLAGGRDNVLLSRGDEVAWWTFAGGRANATLAHELARRLDVRVDSDNFAVRFPPRQPPDLVERGLRDLAGSDLRGLGPMVIEAALEGLKFAECLPHELAVRVVQGRLSDPRAVADALGRRTRVIAEG